MKLRGMVPTNIQQTSKKRSHMLEATVDRELAAGFGGAFVAGFGAGLGADCGATLVAGFGAALAADCSAAFAAGFGAAFVNGFGGTLAAEWGTAAAGDFALALFPPLCNAQACEVRYRLAERQDWGEK